MTEAALRELLFCRLLLFVLYSIFIGVILTSAAVIDLKYGYGSSWDAGIRAGSVWGGIYGLALSPLFAGLLFRKSVWHIFGMVVIPTWLIGFLGEGPIMAGLLPVITYPVAIIISHFALPNTRVWRKFSRHCCQDCGYDLTGLTNSSICPECGAAITPPATEPDGKNDDDPTDSPHPTDPAG